MKQHEELVAFAENNVVPYIGTWIETADDILSRTGEIVVPYIGTWIET